MDKYDVNSYFLNERHISGARIEVYPNNDVGRELVDAYRAHDFRILHFSECLEDGYNFASTEVPHVMECVDEATRDCADGVLVVGLDALLSIRPERELNALSNLLKDCVEQGYAKNVAYLIHSSNLNQLTFNNSRYYLSGQVVYFDGEEVQYERPTIDIVSPKWLTESFTPPGYKRAASLNDLFEQMGNVCPIEKPDEADKYVLLLEPGGLGRLNNRVVYRKKAKDVAERFYQFKADFSEELFAALLEKSVKSGVKPKVYLFHRIGKKNFSPSFAPNSLLILKDDPLWDAFVWMLRLHEEKDSYLSHVLDLGVNRYDFARKYVVDGVVDLLNKENEALFVSSDEDADSLTRLRGYADERSNVIRSFGDLCDWKTLLSEFVQETRNVELARVFLNCGSEVENVEIIRRARSCGAWEKFKGTFPLLDSYLSREQCYPDADLNDYFAQYRRLKVDDSITEAFVRRAFDEAENIGKYQHRTMAFGEYDSLLSKGIATIVVDAMGAEYLPLLLAEARRRWLRVSDYRIVRSNLPTSTQFNEIDEKYNPIEVKELDNIAHNGAVKNETCSSEQNLCASLRVFDDVFTKIREALNNNQFAIVTADHGSTRLAKIAYEKRNDLVRAIDAQSDTEPDDWRYERNSYDKSVPEDVVRRVDPGTNVAYWTIRGYNRFPKSGGKKNEMHGGATLEEALVPFVVFTNDRKSDVLGNALVASIMIETKPAVQKQIIEDPDFDI